MRRKCIYIENEQEIFGIIQYIVSIVVKEKDRDQEK